MIKLLKHATLAVLLGAAVVTVMLVLIGAFGWLFVSGMKAVLPLLPDDEAIVSFLHEIPKWFYYACAAVIAAWFFKNVGEMIIGKGE